MSNVPGLPQNSREIYRSLHRAMSAGLVKSCHDLSEGGLAVAIAEMCMAGRLGCDLKLNGENIDGQIFGEGNGRLLVELTPENAKDFLACFADQLINDVNLVGIVTNTSYLNINHNDQQIISLTLDNLLKAWQGNI